MASPLCQVKFGAGAYASTTNGINATAGSVVVINLISSIGAPTWAIACVYADDLSTVASVNASLTIDPVGRTATFTAPVAGRGYIFQSTINAGNNLATNQPDPTTATTFGIWVPTASGARVLIPNETFESSSTSGWVADVNFPIRNPSSGGAVPTGTGIPHIVGGAQSAAASLIVNADVDPAAAIAATKLAAAGTTGQLQWNSSGAFAGATFLTTDGATWLGLGTGTLVGSGRIRLPYAATDVILGAKASDATDQSIISRTAIDTVEFMPFNNEYTVRYNGNSLIVQGRASAQILAGASQIQAFIADGTDLFLGTNAALNSQHSTVTIAPSTSLRIGTPIGGYSSSPFRWASATIASANAGVTLTSAQAINPNLVFGTGATVAWACTGAYTGTGVEYQVANESGFSMTFMGIAIASGVTSRLAYNTTAAAWRKVS